MTSEAEESGLQDLFACGIARSGAYNRTLTPFGFQAEERTIWQAPDIYAAMSPFMQVSLQLAVSVPSVCCISSLSQNKQN